MGGGVHMPPAAWGVRPGGWGRGGGVPCSVWHLGSAVCRERRLRKGGSSWWRGQLGTARPGPFARMTAAILILCSGRGEIFKKEMTSIFCLHHSLWVI